jgi:hypothetical protein
MPALREKAVSDEEPAAMTEHPRLDGISDEKVNQGRLKYEFVSDSEG